VTSASLLDSLKNNCSQRLWYGPHLVEKMLSDWSVLRTARDWQRVVIEKKGEPGNWSWFKPLHRHHKRYINKQRNRVARLADYPQRARYFLTLTVKPSWFSDDLEAAAAVEESFRKIYHRLRRRFPHLQVLRVVEAQQNGQPHIQAILWGVHLPRGWAAKMYKFCSGYVHVRPVRYGNKAAVSYLGKYLSKPTELNLAALTRWKTQTLTISGKEMREHLGPLMDEKPTGEWVLVEFVCSFDDACILFSEGYAQELYEDPTGPP